ncbi:hypothetical protein [Dehalococcoides mccartyi]|uniref:hypothetical protein n=1 Tax=Dehalococcoides mccartyi TaxID=61435 RepID=UPI001CE5D004|nr:hypothetical protein [Dehalococcoides mccartyi]QYY58434.1 hypothetical protein CWV2_000338 [Dehalococcoides mccartyi]
MSYQQYVRDSEALYDQCCDAFKSGNEANGRRCATASVLFSFIAIESFINNMMDDFASLPKDIFTIHERGLLGESYVQFESSGEKAGQFVLTNRREYKRLEDKILFLIAKFGGGVTVDKGSSLWQKFERAKQLRDSLTHPRKEETPTPTMKDTEEVLETAKEIIQMVSAKVWGIKATF